MTMQRLQPGAHAFVLDKLSYDFKSLGLLAEALDTSGISMMPSGETNHRLALVGDKVAALAVSLLWYPTGRPRVHAADALAAQSNPNLARVANAIGLANVLVLQGMGPVRAAQSTRMMATALEALLGAIYLDSGNNLVLIQSILTDLGLWP
ncbi:hypothetical protein LTR95_016376 [Oleoguttula sp. CCFEE 5521]